MRTSAQQLIDEHQVILRVLDALESTLDESPHEDGLPVAFLRDVVTFSQSFIDACHHGKEEGCLFPCLERLGLPRDSGPIQTMLDEHETGRGLVREIARALDGYEQGTVSHEQAVEPCRAYIELLRQHIEKEDTIFSEMGAALMTDADDADTARCYEATEADHGQHDAMVRLAKLLEQRNAG